MRASAEEDPPLDIVESYLLLMRNPTKPNMARVIANIERRAYMTSEPNISNITFAEAYSSRLEKENPRYNFADVLAGTKKFLLREMTPVERQGLRDRGFDIEPDHNPWAAPGGRKRKTRKRKSKKRYSRRR